jgi:hypothetical protein
MKPLVCGSTFIFLARQGKDGRNKRFQLAMATHYHTPCLPARLVAVSFSILLCRLSASW